MDNMYLRLLLGALLLRCAAEFSNPIAETGGGVFGLYRTTL
jgi:hypothetical protein